MLQQHGIRSEQAASGREALEFLRLYDYDMVLMDLHLPDVPAYEVVRMMRAASLKTPVVIMSDTATVQAKVKALDQGADDFLITPCDAEEVLARIRAVVRRSQGHSNSTLSLALLSSCSTVVTFVCMANHCICRGANMRFWSCSF